jgi:glutamate/tyrosine decarboxylase-like PLP-dependent enzyme
LLGVQNGITDNKRYVIITSKQSHYTIKRSAGVLGIGMDGAVSVDCDEQGRMLPEAVEQAILEAKAQNKIVCCISATCGTTVYGAYDNISALADVAEKYRF